MRIEGGLLITKVKTGVPGLDELIGGGLPSGSSVLVSGKIGTGKSIFAMQYMANGIANQGDFGVLVSFESSKKELYEYASTFGWQLHRHEKTGSLQILGGPISTVSAEMSKSKATLEDLISEVVEAVKTSESKRMALERADLLPLLSLEEEPDIMLQLSDLKERLGELGCTSVLTSEISESGELSEVGAEEILDGVIELYYEGEGLTRDRALEVRKMRGTQHSNQLHFFDITGEGIVIKKMPETPRVPKSRGSSF
jgi:KaiC/GvpD/RAD55 family RecA-like ATPase